MEALKADLENERTAKAAEVEKEEIALLESEGIDLVVRNFTLESERVYYGQTLPGSITLVNRGDTDQQRFFVVRISAEPIDGGSATQIDSINVPSLAAGAEEVEAREEAEAVRAALLAAR